MIRSLLKHNGLPDSGCISLSDAIVRLPHLLTRAGFGDTPVSSLYAVLFTVPYRTPAAEDPARNLSAYAVSRDYHLYFASLFEKILPRLREQYPLNRFYGFADHSPLFEVEAAARAGLGLRGANGLLITPEHSSYVFIGEIITDLPQKTTAMPPRDCERCGACLAACPMKQCGGICRSALTQKKGELLPEEQTLLREHPLLWGCDICQDVCPHTQAAQKSGTLYTTIPFFYENPLPRLTSALLHSLGEEDFACRAYAWRGRAVITRNLALKDSSADSSAK